MNASRRWVLGVAAMAVLLAAIDTYVIVLALPAIMSSVGLGIDQLQAATPIISGFLLGYVVVMPLIGRLSDVHGRRPLLLLCLTLFAAGSLVTASAHGLGSVVAGRALQGLGGGGLVPVTLALVADLWPAERRALPLGVVGGVQELGSVLGPVYGGLILTFGTWQTIFWLNLPLAALLGGCLVVSGRRGVDRVASPARPRLDRVSVTLAGLALASGALSVWAPDPLRDSDSLGIAYSAIGGMVWLTPLTIAAAAAAAVLLLWELRRRTVTRPVLGLRRLAEAAGAIDWAGALLIGIALATVIVSFTALDPESAAISPAAVWLLPAGVLAAGLFVLRERTAADPLVSARELRAPGAFGALLTNLAVGAALMAALLDIPVLARATVAPDSQLGAALVLLRLLVGVPIGAVLGGWLSQVSRPRAVAASGLALSALAFALMTRWTATTLADPLGPGWLHPSDPVLLACGLGFGLAIAPVNTSMLGSVRPALHGLASSLVVVARMIGMLVGISVLTAVGLHAFHTATEALPPPEVLCPAAPLSCPAYESGVTGAILAELHTVFLGAAICAAAAALSAAALLGGRPPARAEATA